MSSFQETFNRDIENQEQQWLSDRRAACDLSGDSSKDTKALAFSGGGIRSATFNLGVLQALAKNDQLTQFDYLSSVSGGSYIATSFTWFKSRFPGRFPFGTSRRDKHASDILAWLRAHSSFLTPGFGVDKSSLLTAILTGTLINMLIMVPLLLLLLFLLSYEFSADLSAIAIHAPFNGFSLLRAAGFLTLIASFGVMLLTAISTGFDSARANHRTETLRYYLSNLFPLGLALLAVGYIPFLHKSFEHFAEWVVHTSFSISLIGITITRYAARRNGNADIKYSLTSLLIDLGLLLTCFGFVMISYHFAVQWELLPTIFYPLLFLSVFLVLGCNINSVSMHGYYRDRLKDAFMPCHLSKRETNDEECEQTTSYDKQLLLGELKATDAPFPIINCNIELLGSSRAKYKNRGGDCFTLTPLYSGSDSTGYRATKDYMAGKLDLASACAISGAAIATNTPMTRSKQLNFIMSLLNLRLGCWLKNPNKPTKPANFFNKPWWYLYMFRDMFGQGLNEQQSYIHLSDGGHFENLACYELIRRKCKLIVCCDAGADPKYQYKDLAKLIELARVDFGAKLAIDVSEINQQEATSDIAWTEGKISYDDGSYGRFIYIKACMIQHLNEDLKSYKRMNPDFPHQSTNNQFFDEMQFEAYRELGFQLAHQMLKSIDLATTATSGEQ
ncbi:patatin-like phospholipase family protein [Pseudoalteromonas sp. BDTF-M6]|uniref:patatin-like phospholipase family protein n=1 Tax=Pseudoalteromonas sp. BDTF-M6 TaxID=2796132 RepID=UPI001BB0C773|nr:patatin-like phospholipase family protein [Pseudoalteromonas sp. BDTF-M6]MBS3797586.1 patatin-like phospholipase family protein [Pseudoalteromonas sp. BDTF-M6]